MKIICDVEAKTMIESLCHTALVHTSRESFIENFGAVYKTLISIELEEQVVTDEPTKPPAPEAGP